VIDEDQSPARLLEEAGFGDDADDPFVEVEHREGLLLRIDGPALDVRETVFDVKRLEILV
jgi:hypothetical protein